MLSDETEVILSVRFIRRFGSAPGPKNLKQGTYCAGYGFPENQPCRLANASVQSTLKVDSLFPSPL